VKRDGQQHGAQQRAGVGPPPAGLSRRHTALLGGISLALAATATLAALDVLFPPPLHRAQQLSLVVTDRHDAPLRAFPVEDGRWRLAAELQHIDPAFIEALLAIEDRRFFHHPGVDPLALLRAAMTLLRTGRVVSGASTITMQTARLLEPRPRRTLGAKFIEALRALQLERRLDKQQILALYLALAPYGGNLEGVHAASWAWFGREPARLTPAQIALLLALPQAPEARRPDRQPLAATQARARLLRRMVARGLLSPERAEEAAQEPIPARQAFPALAWHASDHIRAAHLAAPQALAQPAAMRSTLDMRLQLELERLVQETAAHAGRDVQVAALVVALDGRAVRAAAGSAGRDRAGGWLDLTRRARSPGSVLKPLIYALAFEDGLVMAGTRIEDLPRAFAGYEPGNFDREFRGEVTVAQALQQSLNVPAVQLLAAVGAPRYAATLALAGADVSLAPGGDGQGSLALALGGMAISVQDVASLYAALGSGGEALPLAWTEAAAAANRAARGHRLVSAQSAQRVLEILLDAPPPVGRMPARLLAGAPQMAFKTGTSWGFRDAWAAGITGGHAIVVWVGRPDGAPRPGVTGRQAALPLLFELAETAAHQGAPAMLTAGLATGGAIAPQHALARFGDAHDAPEILFPPDGAQLWSDTADRGFVPAARGSGPLRWYADGQLVTLDAAGAPWWRPEEEGFHELVVVDRDGRSARTRVRVSRF
jgi:penicillin-binding protein 1C